jgi:hypothetical protein
MFSCDGSDAFNNKFLQKACKYQGCVIELTNKQNYKQDILAVQKKLTKNTYSLVVKNMAAIVATDGAHGSFNNYQNSQTICPLLARTSAVQKQYPHLVYMEVLNTF